MNTQNSTQAVNGAVKPPVAVTADALTAQLAAQNEAIAKLTADIAAEKAKNATPAAKPAAVPVAKPVAAPAAVDPMADIVAELARLRAENESLKKPAGQAQLSLRISEKGGLSVYGLGRFPVTLYKEQWTKLLAASDAIRAFIKANDKGLKAKGDN